MTSPGPAGIGAALTARIGGIPLIGSYHTELAAYARLRSGDPRVELAARAALSAFYRQCELVLSPSLASDGSLAALGVEPGRVRRWVRGVDLSLYSPERRDPDAYPGEVKVLYAGRLSSEKGAELLAESFLLARERDPRLHLLLAGGGPEEQLLRVRLGEHATFLGWLDREQLADAYASADVFLFCSRTDTYGQVIVEAQASGLPVVAVERGRPRVADPGPPNRPALRPDARAARRGGRPARGLPVPLRADRAGGARRGPGPDLGGGARPTRRRLRRRARRLAAQAEPTPVLEVA